MTPNADPAAPAQGAAAGDQISTGPIQGVGIAVGTGASVQIYGDIHYYPITLHAPLRERFAPLIADRIGLFAGRDPILNRIMHRIQDPAGGYTVLTAPAGFGKTALMAALIHRTPAAFAYHFFTTLYGEDGLSERFFLRNVVEQMARWHGREERVPTDLDELRALYHALRDAPRDHTRILILDGLDEVAAWDPAPYLSRPLGERLHMIVTIRDVGQDWLATYRFPPHQVFPLPLGGLDRDATIAVFQAAGPQSAALVADAAVAAVLRVAAHADAPKLGADPFYVRLLAEDAAQGHVTAATIAAQPTGLNAYLDQWWEAIRRQAGDQPVRDLFGTLTGAATALSYARAADRTVALAAVPSAQHERILALTAAESGSDPRGETLDLWDAQTGTHLQQVPPQGSAIATLALHGAADAGTTRLTLITAHYDHYLRVWALDRPGPSAVAAVARDAWAVEAAFAPDARRALIRVEGVAQSIWDTATAQAHAIGPADAPLVELLDRARGEQRDRVARAYALIEQRERPEPPPSEARAASGKPGRRLLVVGGAEARLFVAAATETHALTYLQDGAKGAETEESGPPDPRFALRYWDLTDPTAEPLELRGHSLRVYCSALSGAGLRAVSAGAGRVVRVWDLRTGAALWALPGHQGTVWGLAVTPDGRYALSASEDRTVRLWDLEHGAAVATYTGDLPFRRCALSADARHAVAIDVFGRAHLLQAIRPDA
jgi:hypothetical protein